MADQKGNEFAALYRDKIFGAAWILEQMLADDDLGFVLVVFPTPEPGEQVVGSYVASPRIRPLDVAVILEHSTNCAKAVLTEGEGHA